MARRECPECGAEVAVTFRWNGLAEVVEYRDEQGELITHCPECGEWLGRETESEDE